MTADYDQLIAAGRQARNEGRLGDAERLYAGAATAATDDLRRAHALRHVSDIGSDREDFVPALSVGQEALALYRRTAGLEDLDHANAVRVVARAFQGSGRADEAAAAWREARELYAAAGVRDGVEECDRQLA